MGKRTSYAPGAFCWVDLATTDAAAAKSFYNSLLGWEMEDNAAAGGAYTTCRIEGDAVCGLFVMPEDRRAMGARPKWTSYVSVDSADATVARATELGDGAIDDAFYVRDLGRMAVLNDPQGAAFAVWQPRTRTGAERVNDVGCLCMNELATTDVEAARSFYEGLFGWTTETVDAGPDGPLGYSSRLSSPTLWTVDAFELDAARRLERELAGPPVCAQHLEPRAIAEGRVQPCGVLDVGEHDRHGAVGSGGTVTVETSGRSSSTASASTSSGADAEERLVGHPDRPVLVDDLPVVALEAEDEAHPERAVGVAEDLRLHL